MSIISLLYLVTILLAISFKLFFPRLTLREVQVNRMVNVYAYTLLIISGVGLLLKSGLLGIQVTASGPWFSSHWMNEMLFSMIAFLGFVILKYSINYLGGDQHKSRFIGNISGALASALLLVSTNHLLLLFIAWIGASYFLNKLLLHYRDRIGAQQAALKKFVMARLSDVFLGLAIVLLYQGTGTWNIDTTFELFRAASAHGFFPYSEIIAYSLVLAAIFKAAQFPFHGWLIEVMETPTPVSALLHAGLLNAGPFLILRMSVLLENSGASIFLMVIGGISMLFGPLSQSTQTSVKTALAYSSIGHMGFSLFLSGSGLYTAALLHLIAHSTYKAYEFLTSGSTLTKVEIPEEHYKTKTGPFILSLFLTALLFILPIQWYLEAQPGKEKLLLVAALFSIGMVQFIHSAIKFKINALLPLVLVFNVLFTLASFLIFEMGIEHLIVDSHHNQWTDHGAKFYWMVGITGVVLLVGFLLQAMRGRSNSSRVSKWSIHFKNGLYVNDYFDHHIGPRITPYLKNFLSLSSL